jgi:phenylacetate-CoA ligase
VPYYKELFEKHGIIPDTINSLDSLKKIPFLTKDIIKSRYADFISVNADPADLEDMTTGGSTGAPLKIMMDPRFKALDLANTYFYMHVAGFNPLDFRSIRLHGNILDSRLIEKGVYWTLEDNRRLVMSSYHISEETAGLYVDAINNHKPDYLHAFPSSASLLAYYIEKLDLSLNVKMKCVFCDCEVLYDYQRNLIERVFSGKVYNTYGHTEGSVLGITCPHSNKIHLVPQVGIVELLDSQGNPITKPGVKGEIVVTGFYNTVMPFIRYRTFDVGIYSEQTCSCQRNFLLLDAVEGRIQDYVIDKNRHVIPIAPALFDYNFDWSGVDRFQVYQDTPGDLTFKVVLDNKTDNPDEIISRIIKGFEKILNSGFRIEVKIMDTIYRTNRGKYRYLEQKLDLVDDFRKDQLNKSR